MWMKNAIERTRSRFRSGQFSLLPNEVIDQVVRRENVPDVLGVYLYCASHDLEHPLYIGKAGTMNTDGSWKEQRLKKRLTMKQDGEYRRVFFCKLMASKGYAGLTFIWFETFDQNVKVIPALAEMELLQAYYDQYGKLPELNNCV